MFASRLEIWFLSLAGWFRSGYQNISSTEVTSDKDIKLNDSWFSVPSLLPERLRNGRRASSDSRAWAKTLSANVATNPAAT